MDKREKGREKERKKVNRATSLAGSTTTRRTRTDTHRTGPLQAISDLFLLYFFGGRISTIVGSVVVRKWSTVA